MRLGPILQAIVVVPELASARDWALVELELAVTRTGVFPHADALTLGARGLSAQPCLTLGTAAAPGLLLLVEDAAAGDFPETPCRGWSGLQLQRPGPVRDGAGLGVRWSLVDGPASLTAVTLSTLEPAPARGYYQGLGTQAPRASMLGTLPLHQAVLQIQQLPEAGVRAVGAGHRPAGLLAVLMGRGSASATLSAPSAHSEGADGEWLLLRDQPILPIALP